MARQPRRPPPVALVRQFVEAHSWSASRVVVERNNALLSDNADDILTDLHALASARGDSTAAHPFEIHQAALRRYRKLGDAAFES